jgi:uncharacterized protein (DUF952 family)
MFIYKILPAAPADPLPEQFPLSSLDQDDGFVHLSTATQVPTTCTLFFADFPAVWIVELDLASFGSLVKFEESMPHLYGNFGAADVKAVHKFERPEGKTWVEAFTGSQ